MLTSQSQLDQSTSLRGLRQPPWALAFAAPVIAAPLWLSAGAGSFSGLLLFLLLACATVTDLDHRKIYNWATYTAFAWGLGLNMFVSPSTPWAGSIGPSASIAGAGLCLALMLVPYMLARGGAGDVKLAVAIGTIVGTHDGVLIIGFTYIIAGAAIMSWSIWTQGPLNLASAMLRRLGATLLPQQIAPPDTNQALILDKPIPLAGFFAVGTLCVLFDAPALLRSL